jgi:hypothetical protein
LPFPGFQVANWKGGWSASTAFLPLFSGPVTTWVWGWSDSVSSDRPGGGDAPGGFTTDSSSLTMSRFWESLSLDILFYDLSNSGGKVYLLLVDGDGDSDEKLEIWNLKSASPFGSGKQKGCVKKESKSDTIWELYNGAEKVIAMIT